MIWDLNRNAICSTVLERILRSYVVRNKFPIDITPEWQSDFADWTDRGTVTRVFIDDSTYCHSCQIFAISVCRMGESWKTVRNGEFLL